MAGKAQNSPERDRLLDALGVVENLRDLRRIQARIIESLHRGSGRVGNAG